MSASSNPTTRPASPLRAFDRGLLKAEESVLAAFLCAMPVLVFVDVLTRKIEDQRSIFGLRIAGWMGTEDPATLATLHGIVSPLVVAVIAFGLFWFGLSSAEKKAGERMLPVRGSAAIVSLGIVIGFAVFAWLVLHTSSRVVYGALVAGATLAFVLAETRAKKDGWQRRLGQGLAFIAPIALAVAFFPDGYTWSKEMSTILLLWVGFFGASLCVPTGKHLRVEALEKAIPEKLRPYVLALGYLAASLFAGLLAWHAYQYVFGHHGLWESNRRLDLTRIPSWVQGIAVPIALGVASVRLFASAVARVIGSDYGAPAKAEGMEEAEAAAKALAEQAALESPGQASAPKKQRPPIVLGIVLALIVVLPFLGTGGILASAVLALVLLGSPIFVILGCVSILCFVLFPGEEGARDLSRIGEPSVFPLVNRMFDIGDNQALLAVPFFVMSGDVMRRGAISRKLISISMAMVGWLPGGLGLSAVVACIFYAAISGSSPATVVAIGGVMAPALIAQGYRGQFAHGLVTTSGSLGILIPPSIPMIIYSIVNQRAHIEVERLFACGYGPGLVIGSCLAVLCIVEGVRNKTPTQAFSLGELGTQIREGFWALMFPVSIAVGIYSGLFNAIEAAAFSVVYAVGVEVFVHRAIKLTDIPKIFAETSIMLGSFLVILTVAMLFGEWMEQSGSARSMVEWVQAQELTQWQFLLVLNGILLVVGCLLDIMSAMFVFVPLLAPIAASFGVDPLHFGLIFIVNLEIGYMTPPMGLNLFVASTLFGKPVGYLVRSVAPFLLAMVVGLLIVTYVPATTVGVAELLMGPPAHGATPMAPEDDGEIGDEPEDSGTGTGQPVARPRCEPPEDLNCDGQVTMEEMTEFTMGGGAEEESPEEAPTPSCEPPEDLNCDGTVTMEEITEYTSR